MRQEAIASRYGKALFQLTQASNNQERVTKELSVLATIFQNDPLLSAFADSPLVRDSAKEGALDLALSSLNLDQASRNFLLVLARRGRLGLLTDILNALQRQIDLHAGLTRGKVTTAAELSESEKKEITEMLEKVTSRKVTLNFFVDPKICGGLTAEVGGLSVDDSIRSHLKNLQEELNRRTH